MDTYDSGCRGMNASRPTGCPEGFGLSGLKNFFGVRKKKCRNHTLLVVMGQLVPTRTVCTMLIHRGVVADGAI